MTLEYYLEKMKGFDQKSPAHDLDLFEHVAFSVEKAKELKYSDDVITALWWHDVGKLYSITTDNEGWQHYFGHPEKSAEIYKDSCETFSEKIYYLIKFHDEMITNEFLSHNDVLGFGKEFIIELFNLKVCDYFAHEQRSREHFFPKMEQQLNIVYDMIK